MEAQVTWKNRMSFTGSSDSGFTVDLGTEPEVGGDNDGFRPLELMAISLAGCTAMDVISILSKKRQQVSGFDVKVNTERAAEHPRVFTQAVITYTVIGTGVDEAAVRRAIELSAQRYCPAQAMLAKVFPMTLRYQIFEAGEGAPVLTAEGEYAAA